MKQANLFNELPPPAEKLLRFKPAERPIWTENKARLIERYLFYFVLITKHGAYIDGFAAPQYPDKTDAWAAKLVLESKPPLLKKFWLCDLNKQGVAALEGLKAAHQRKGRDIKVIPGDFNETVNGLLKSSGITESMASFCLLDQRTFECEWRTLETIARHKQGNKIELFYFLATGWLDRSIKATKNEGILHRWWGRDDWKSLQSMNSIKRALLFCDRFKDELGYKHVYPFPIYSREKSGGRIMYHMIHASDHDEAPKLMNRAYRNATNDREAMKRLQHDLSELWG